MSAALPRSVPADGTVATCLAALARGAVLLHPTDTLPGLTFDPRLPEGPAHLAALKGRPLTQVCLALVPDLAAAVRYFAPLPAGWQARLARLWPGPLSLVFRASAAAPAALVSADGTIGLRVPRLPPEAAWILDLLRALDAPLPTTSVNATGEPPLARWSDAAAFCARQAGTFVPACEAKDTGGVLPSTIIRLADDGAYTVLRAGALPLESLA